MNHFLQFAVLSAGTAALYVWVTLAVVVVYRGSGIINLAQGAYLVFGMHLLHDLTVNHHMGLAPAIAVTILGCVGVGLATYWLVIRPLHGASLVTRVVATLGVVIVVTATVRLFWEATDLVVAVLPIDSVDVVGAPVTIDRVLYLVLAVVATVILWAGYRFTTAGLATEAVSENQRAASTLGWSPDMIAGASWSLAGLLAGITAALIYPAQPTLTIDGLVFVIVPALAAALTVGFRSFPLAALAAVGLAVVQQELNGIVVPAHPWVKGVEHLVPLIVIMAMLVWRGSGLPTRGHLSERRPILGQGGVPLWLVLPAIALALIGVWTAIPTEWVNAIAAQAVWAILLLSVVVVLGYAGQLSLGQIAFAGIAAVVAGRLVAALDTPFPVAATIGIVAATVTGAVFALPSLRTRGLSLAILTLSLGVVVNALLFTRTYYSPSPAGTSGPGGFGVAPEGTRVAGRVHLFGLDLERSLHPQAWATFCLVVLLVLSCSIATLRRSRAGRRLIAVRTNERAAAALGISVRGAKFYAFTLSAFIAGVGGILLAFSQSDIRYSVNFNPFQSILLVGYAVVGGVGFVIGALFGAVLLPHALGQAAGSDISAWVLDIGHPQPWLSALIVGAVAFLLSSAVVRRIPSSRWVPWAAAGVGGVVGAIGCATVGSVLGSVDAAIPLAPWIGATMVGLAAWGGARAVTTSVDRAPRWMPLAALAGGLLLARFVFADVVTRWMTDLERYLPLIAGVLIILIMLQEGDGLAAVGVRLARSVTGDRQRRRDRRAAAELEVMLSAEESHGSVPPRRLEVRGMHVRFGAVVAAEDVSLEVAPGEVVGLIGPNGAGKTTSVDAITGYLRPDAGEVLLDGARIDGLQPHRRALAGVSRTFQNLELFEDLTVAENIATASDRRDVIAYLANLFMAGRQRLSSTAAAAIREFALEDDLQRRVSELSYGRRRLVAVARAVATRPSVLLLDEPAAGLDEQESREFRDLIGRLAREWGIGVLVIEHDMGFIMGLCDRVVVLDFGHKIADGTPNAVRADPAVIAAYLGVDEPTADDPLLDEPETVEERQMGEFSLAGSRSNTRPGFRVVPTEESPLTSASLAARHLTAGYGELPIVHDLDLFVAPGEVVVLLGANGSGKTTTLLTLAGELTPLAGEIDWLGQPSRSPLHRRCREGMAFVTEERSVFMGLTARENLRVGRCSPEDVLESFPELEMHLDRKVGLLSGGQQQMLALGRALARKPRVLLADELSLGLAPIVVDRLLSSLRAAADSGVAVLLVEQHVRKALTIADRVYLLRNGRLAFSGTSAEAIVEVAAIEAAYLDQQPE